MLLEEANKIKRNGILGLILIFTLIGAIITIILDIINAIKIITTNWGSLKLESQKVLWGILSLIFLGPVSGIIFGCIAVNELGGSKW